MHWATRIGWAIAGAVVTLVVCMFVDLAALGARCDAAP